MLNIEQTKYDKNGLKHGEWSSYHGNGKLFHRVNYVHGIKHGLQEGYTPNGLLIYRGYRNMGRRVGYWYNSQKKYYLWLI